MSVAGQIASFLRKAVNAAVAFGTVEGMEVVRVTAVEEVDVGPIGSRCTFEVTLRAEGIDTVVHVRVADGIYAKVRS